MKVSDIKHSINASVPHERVTMVKVRVWARSPCLTSYVLHHYRPFSHQSAQCPFYIPMRGQGILVALIRRRGIGAVTALAKWGVVKSIAISFGLTFFHIWSWTPFTRHLSRMDRMSRSGFPLFLQKGTPVCGGKGLLWNSSTKWFQASRWKCMQNLILGSQYLFLLLGIANGNCNYLIKLWDGGPLRKPWLPSWSYLFIL